MKKGGKVISEELEGIRTKWVNSEHYLSLALLYDSIGGVGWWKNSSGNEVFIEDFKNGNV